MKTALVKSGPLLLGGFSYYGDPVSAKGCWDSENEIGKTWQRFTAYISENPVRAWSMNKKVLYEVHIYGSETMSKGFFEVFVGEEVNSPYLPVALSSKFIPAFEYVKITLSGKEIVGDWWNALDTEIFPALKVKRNYGFMIQAYDERFSMDRLDDSVLDVFIPIESETP